MTTDRIKKICVILGAGASKDIAGEGAPIVQSEFQPPLARDLFNISNHRAYWEIMNIYNGAKILTQELAQLVSSGPIPIEDALRRYAEHPDERIRQHFKHIPAYLRDLLWRVSSAYVPMPTNYVRLVVELLAHNPHDVLFLVLNYDNLLESALSHFDTKFEFKNMPQYVASDRQAKVVKLHGSINWFKLLPGDQGESWETLVTKIDISKELSERIYIDDNSERVANRVIEDHRVYPVLTAPLAGKGISDAVCPKDHINTAKEFLHDCNKFLIIGSSGLDKDLLNLLDSAINTELHPVVHIVDMDQGADKARTRFYDGVRAFRNSDIVPPITVFKNGFRIYLNDAQLQRFAASPEVV